MLMSSSMHIFEMMATGTVGQSRANAGAFNTDYAIRLFSGQRPTSAQIAALVNATTTTANYVMNRLPALLTSLGSVVVATVSPGSGSNLTVGMAPNKITLALGQLNLSLSSLTDEAPTWGLIYLFPSTTNSNPDSWIANALLYFTVGDTGSGADLIIPGGVLPKYNIWKPDDIEITLANVVN